MSGEDLSEQVKKEIVLELSDDINLNACFYRKKAVSFSFLNVRIFESR